MLMAFVGLSVFALDLLGSSLAWCAVVASPSPDKAQDLIFLQLPAYDVSYTIARGSGALKNQKAESTKVVVGDTLEMSVAIPTQAGSVADQKLHLEVPRGVSLSEAGWEADLESPPASVGATKGNEDVGFRVVPIKAGSLALPSLGLKDSQGNAVARTNPVSIEVISAIPENDPNPTHPADIEPPVGLKFPFWVVAGLSTLVVIAFLLGVYGIYRLWRKRKPRLKRMVSDSLTEDEIALKELNELSLKNLIQQGKYKLYYFRISEILKSYMGSRYHFDAPESTTQEVIAHLEQRPDFTRSLIGEVEVIFEKLDRVKFTDYLPSEQESIQMIDLVKSLVMSTRRQIHSEPSVAATQRSPEMAAGGPGQRAPQ
jgi:hypothetical protein